jgi:hypothetical protein
MPEMSSSNPIDAPDQRKRVRAALDAVLDMLADEVVKKLQKQSMTKEAVRLESGPISGGSLP